ncbi:MAG TPA: tetratricopeptide repeat protein [Chroococcales cyanobacterium]
MANEELKNLEEAKKAYREGRYGEAVSRLEALLQQDPAEGNLWLMLARAYERNGQEADAGRAYRLIIEAGIEPLSEHARQGLAKLVGDEPPSFLPLRALQSFCLKRPAAIFFRIGKDLYWLDGNRVRVEYAQGKGWAFNPRLCIPLHDGLPVVPKEALVPLENDHLFRLVEATGTLTLSFEETRRMLQWNEHFEPDLSAFLLESGFLPKETLLQATKQRREEETLGSTLLRLNLETLERMIEAVIGRGLLPYGVARPFSERIGALATGQKQAILKQALSRQAHEHHPLGVLLENLGIDVSILKAALARQKPVRPTLPEADGLGEILVRWAVIDRTVLARLRAAGGAPEALEAALLNGKHCPPEVIERAKRYSRDLSRALTVGKRRLGSILISRGTLTGEQLEKTLAWQVDQPYPLGELLVQHRLCPPEEVIAALSEQIQGYREEIEALLPPLPRKEFELELELKEEKKDRRMLLLWGGMALVSIVALAFTLRPFIPLPWLRPGIAEKENLPVPDGLGGDRARLGAGTDPLQHKPLDPGGAEAVSLPGELQKTESAPSYRPGSLKPSPVETFLGEEKRLSLDPATLSLSPPGGMSPGFGDSGEKKVGSLKKSNDLLPLVPSPLLSGLSGAEKAKNESGTFEGKYEQKGFWQAKQEGQFSKLSPDRIRAEEKKMGVSFEGKGAQAGMSGTMDLDTKDGKNIKRSSAVFRSRLGEAHLRGGEIDSAAIEFLAAIALDPTVAPPYYHLGSILEKKGDFEGARAHYQRYLEFAPNSEFSDDAREGLKRTKR